MLERRVMANPNDAKMASRLFAYQAVPLIEEGQPEVKAPGYEILSPLHKGQIEALKQPAATSPPGGAILATEDELTLWMKDLALIARDSAWEERGYFLRLPAGRDAAPNEGPMGPALVQRLFVMPSTKLPFLQALAMNEADGHRLHILLAGPKQTFGHEVRLWIHCEELGHSFLWPGNEGLWLGTSWRRTSAKNFVSASLPWLLPRTKPVLWEMSAAVGEYVMPLQAAIEIFPDAQWNTEILLSTAPSQGSRVLPIRSPSLASGEIPASDWHVSGLAECSGKDFTEELGRHFLETLPFLQNLGALTDFLKAVAGKSRQANMPEASVSLAVKFEGGPFAQQGSGLIGARWRFSAKGKPVYRISHECDFLPWLAEQKRKGSFLRYAVESSQTYGYNRKIGLRLETEGRLDLDWRFEGKHPGLPQAEGASHGRVSVSVWGNSNLDYEGVIIQAGSAANIADGAGLLCRLETTLDVVAGTSVGPAVSGQFLWKGLAITGGKLQRAGITTGDPQVLIGLDENASLDIISEPQGWPAVPGASQIIGV